MTSDCIIPINTKLPLLQPYRTGAYLIYDFPAGTTDDHFRRGDDPKLGPNTFRGSGSRQLDAGPLAGRLNEVAKLVRGNGKLHLVDLRQESHVFINNDRAVSWYSDKDWANVGQSLEWIEADEQIQISRIIKFSPTRVFCLDPNKEFAIPTKYKDVNVTSAATEGVLAKHMQLPVVVDYIRLPITDHCPPPDIALNEFLVWCFERFGPDDWVHFHCHGGDGRTTTFMALFDMVSWWKAHGSANFPSMEQFAQRQYKLFPYKLNPTGCEPNKDWKCALAQERWKVLNEVRDTIASGKLGRTRDAETATGV